MSTPETPIWLNVPPDVRPSNTTRRWTPTTAAVILTVLYFVTLSYFSTIAHFGLQTQMNDLGNADQALWAAAHGDWHMTQSNDPFGFPRSRFGVHVNLIFLPLSLLYRVWADPVVLLILASLACSAAGFGLFLIGRHRFGPTWWALAPPAAFLLSPMVHDANLYDFHIVTVSTALIVWAVWAFETGKSPLGFVLIILALTCKEDVSFTVTALGLSFVFLGRRRKGAALIGLSAAYLLLVETVFVPWVDPVGLSQAAAARYAWVFDTPLRVLSTMVRPDRLRVPVYFLLSGLLTALRGRRWMPLLIPSIGMALLSETLWMTRITGTYYWITAEAAIVLVCIEAARSSTGRFRPAPLGWLLGLTVVFSTLFSPLPYGLHATMENFRHSEPGIAGLEAVSNLIPPSDALSVQNNLGPHLSQRPDIAAFPRRAGTARWALFDVHYRGGPCSGLFVRTTPRFMMGMDIDGMETAMESLVTDRRWRLAAVEEGFYLFSRRGEPIVPTEQAIALLEDDFTALRRDYRRALDSLSPLAGLTVGRLSWSDLLAGRWLAPGNLPADPVGFLEASRSDVEPPL